MKKSLEQRLFEAYCNCRGLRLTADDVDSLVADDAMATRISNRACKEAGTDVAGEDCIVCSAASGVATWHQFLEYLATQQGVI